jgi:hypothetical protein
MPSDIRRTLASRDRRGVLKIRHACWSAAPGYLACSSGSGFEATGEQNGIVRWHQRNDAILADADFFGSKHDTIDGARGNDFVGRAVARISHTPCGLRCCFGEADTVSGGESVSGHTVEPPDAGDARRNATRRAD